MKKLVVLCIALMMVFVITNTAMAGFTYYIPYFTSETGYWTGVGVSNTSTSTAASVSVVVYDEGGAIRATDNQFIAANGQGTFIVGSGLTDVTGWMKINSDQALTGLCFFGTEDPDWLYADIPLIHTPSTSLHIPHAPQDTTYDTTIFVCNPNNSINTVTITFVNTQGTEVTFQNYILPPNGSGSYALETILGEGNSYSAGKVEITALQGVAAFSLFTNTKSGNKKGFGGISAVDTQDQGSASSECTSTSSVEVIVTNALTGSVISGATVSAIDATGDTITATTDSSGVASLTGLPGEIDVLITTSASGYVSQPTTVTTTCGQDSEISVSLLPEGDTGTLRGDIRIILTWGENPRDLDSHLAGPAVDGSANYHIYYNNRNYDSSSEGPSNPNHPAWLDVDDQYSYGPETITISKIDGSFVPGTYKYYVHHYAGSSNIPNSGAHVKVYEGETLVGTYTPPDTTQSVTDDWVWKVFTLTISSDDTYSISVISEYFGPVSSGDVFSSAIMLDWSQTRINSEDYDLFTNLPPK